MQKKFHRSNDPRLVQSVMFMTSQNIPSSENAKKSLRCSKIEIKDDQMLNKVNSEMIRTKRRRNKTTKAAVLASAYVYLCYYCIILNDLRSPTVSLTYVECNALITSTAAAKPTTKTIRTTNGLLPVQPLRKKKSSSSLSTSSTALSILEKRSNNKRRKSILLPGLWNRIHRNRDTNFQQQHKKHQQEPQQRQSSSLISLHSNLQNNIDNIDSESSTVKDKNHQRQQNLAGLSLSLSVSYFTVMAAKCALPAVLSLLQDPVIGLTFPLTTVTSNSVVGSSSNIVLTTPQQFIAKLLFLSTLAIASGKLLLGPFIDSIGGIRSLQYALIGLFFSLGTISVCQSFTIFAICWILVDFLFSSCWAACMNAIQQSYTSTNKNNNNNGYDTKTEWTKQISYLAASARIGNTIAFSLFAATLQYFTRIQYKQSWRPVFAISAILQLVPLFMLTYYGNKQVSLSSTINPAKSTSTANTSISMQSTTTPAATRAATTTMTMRLRQSIRVLQYEIQTIDFWLHLISRSVLMVYASFLLFVPTLLSTVYAASSATAARCGSLYALGCLVAVTFGTPIYNRLTTTTTTLSSSFSSTDYIKSSTNIRSKILAISVLLLFGATGTSLTLLGHMMNYWTISIPVCSVLMFVWGLSFSIPFYIPPSLYALQRGDASATIADVFDIGGFALLALFNGYVASITNKIQRSAWIGTFTITTICSLISYFALSIAFIREERRKEVAAISPASATSA